MFQIDDLLPLLKEHVNAVEFDGDDALLLRNLKRALRQVLGMCNLTLSELLSSAKSMEDYELEQGLPADFAGSVLELAAAMYRYGEAYSESSFRFTPSFEMTLSRYRKHFDPYNKEE